MEKKTNYLRILKDNITAENLAKKMRYLALSRISSHPHYKNVKMELSLEELTEFIKSRWEDIEPMCLRWKEHNFCRKHCPSLDRLDPKRGYSLDNIQIITFSENARRSQIGNHRRKTNKHKKKLSESLNKYVSVNNMYGAGALNAKPVLQKTIDGKTIKRWECALDAVKECGFSSAGISKVCSGAFKKHKGYIWEYADKTKNNNSIKSNAFNV